MTMPSSAWTKSTAQSCRVGDTYQGSQLGCHLPADVPNLIPKYIVNPNSVAVIRIARLTPHFHIFANRSLTIVESAAHDFSIKDTVQLIGLVNIIVKVFGQQDLACNVSLLFLRG